MFKKMDKETFWGGIFGAIAIIATIVELFTSGFSLGNIASAVKDVFGTLVVIVLFIAVIKDNIPVTYKDFAKAFQAEMKQIEEKYAPVICRDDKAENRYNIASKLTCLYDYNVGTYRTFFDYTENTLTFSVKKEIFMGRSKDSFETMQAKIIGDICTNLEKTFEFVESCERGKDKFIVVLKKSRQASDEASNMASVVERVILLYVAESE